MGDSKNAAVILMGAVLKEESKNLCRTRNMPLDEQKRDGTMRLNRSDDPNVDLHYLLPSH